MKRPLTRISNPFFFFKELSLSNMKEQVGIDVVIFHAKIKTIDFSVEIKFPLYPLMEYSKKAHPKIAAYFEDVRKRIPGPGDRNQEIVDIMLEEKFDFFPLLGDYIDKEIDIVRYYKEEQAWEAETADQTKDGEEGEEGEECEGGEYCEDCGVYHEKQHKLSKEELDELWAPLKKFSEKQQQFAEELMAAMSEKVREHYPEFAEADTERLMELTSILSTGADDIAGKVAFLSGPPADTAAYITVDE